MATLKELHDLVHALDKNEKKFISLSMGALAGKARDRYLNTFKTINEQEVFDAEKLKKKLGAGVSGMSLTEANNYVYDFICKAIVGYQPGKKLGYTNHLKLIELLINRKLFATAHAMLLKLIPQLEEQNSFALSQRAYELQEIITISYPPVNRDINFRLNFFKARMELGNMHRQNIEFTYLLFRFFQVVKSVGEPRNAADAQKYRELWQEPLLHTPIGQIHDRTIKMCYQLRGALMSVLNMPGAEEELKNQLKVFRERFKNKKQAFGEIDILDLMLSTMGTKTKIDWKELSTLKARVNELLADVPTRATHQRMQAKVIILELIYYIRCGKYSEGIKRFEQCMGPRQKELWQEAPLAYMIPFTGARLLFLNNDPNRALDYLLLIQEQEKVMRTYFLISYRFLFLQCHYKLRNYQFLDSAVISLTRSLKKLDQLYAPEKAMLQFLQHAGNVNKYELQLKKLSTALTALKTDPYHKIFFEFGDYDEWLKPSTDSQK